MRANVRYPVQVPVIFGWIDNSGRARGGKGSTRDISPTGIHVTTAVNPPCGVSVDMKIYLPPTTGDSRGLVEAKGVVLRIDRGGRSGASGFSIQTTRMALCAS
jgi:PilZ domain